MCVDWDGDGIPDDWEIAYGLNPGVNDAGLDSDGDGVPNWLEYQRGTDPFNADSDGDGISDGAEKKNPGYSGGSGSSLSADASVQVLASDTRGLTLELVTKSFDVTPVEAGGQAFERLRVPAYVHGYTLEPGLPQVPLKGILLDIPQGKQARVEVLEATSRVLAGYRVYPAPVHEVGANNQVAEVFRWDEAAYQQNAYYPAVAAELSTEYVFRGQAKQRLIFYPLRFNPGTGELLHCERLRVRVEFDAAFASGEGEHRRAAAAAVAHRAPRAAWSPAAGAAYKVSTNGEGIYRVTRDWLTAQGIGPTEIDAIDLSHVQLFNLGAEQAIHVYDQNANHRLDAADYISFYAAAVPAAYAKYAKYNVYWLIDAGSASPLRMGSINGTPSGGAAGSLAQLQGAPRAGPGLPAVGRGGRRDGPLDLLLGCDGRRVCRRREWPRTSAFRLPGALSTGELTIRLYSPYAMAHETTVSLNGSPIGSAAWSGIGWTEAAFAGVSLLDGANTVSSTLRRAPRTRRRWTGSRWSTSGPSRRRPTHSSSRHAGGYRYQVADFSTNDVELYDITDAAAVQRVLNGTYTGSGPYTLEVEPAGATGTRSYLAVASAALKTPAAVVKDRASSLAAGTNAADWILITHRSLGWDGSGAQQGWVDSLVALRQSQGLADGSGGHRGHLR